MNDSQKLRQTCHIVAQISNLVYQGSPFARVREELLVFAAFLEQNARIT